MISPGDMVTPPGGWDGLPIFDSCHNDGVGRSGAWLRSGSISCRDTALVIAVMGTYALVVTSASQFGWIHVDCLMVIALRQPTRDT